MTQVAAVRIDAGQLPSVESGVNISTAARRWRRSHGLSPSRDPGEDAAAVVRRPGAAFSPCQPHPPWMIVPMGCGGSRADAIIEPRYHESWTRETESTWLTNTDVETSLPVANSKALEASLREKRMVNTSTQCGKQALTSSSSNHQRRPKRSLSDVGVTGSSKPLVRPRGGPQKRPVRCLRMGSPSASTAAETLGTCVMKDEEKPNPCEEEDGGRSFEKFTRRRDGDLQTRADDV
ncbi:uncharacterized protein AB9W97_001878 isoform 1-T1 [Spinachia spinachia]